MGWGERPESAKDAGIPLVRDPKRLDRPEDVVGRFVMAPEFKRDLTHQLVLGTRFELGWNIAVPPEGEKRLRFVSFSPMPAKPNSREEVIGRTIDILIGSGLANGDEKTLRSVVLSFYDTEHMRNAG